MSEFHDDFTELLGAYALDAVDPDERERIEVHLRSCPFCAAEVAEHREVASFLSHSGTDAPEGVWDRIAAELSPPAPPLRMSFSRSGEVDPLAAPASAPESEAAPQPVAPVISLAGRRSVRLRTFSAVAVAAAVLLVAVVVLATGDRGSVGPADQAATTQPPSAGSVQVSLIGADGESGAHTVIDPSGKGYLVSHDLPDPGRDELYQLWGVVDGTVLSLGTFDGGTEVVNFQVDPKQLPEVEAFAVTKEQAPGVVASDQPAVLSGKVA